MASLSSSLSNSQSSTFLRSLVTQWSCVSSADSGRVLRNLNRSAVVLDLEVVQEDVFHFGVSIGCGGAQRLDELS